MFYKMGHRCKFLSITRLPFYFPFLFGNVIFYLKEVSRFAEIGACISSKVPVSKILRKVALLLNKTNTAAILLWWLLRFSPNGCD
jgi:hypothetical protein